MVGQLTLLGNFPDRHFVVGTRIFFGFIPNEILGADQYRFGVIQCIKIAAPFVGDIRQAGGVLFADPT